VRKIKLSELFPLEEIIGDDIHIDGLNLLTKSTDFNSILSYVETTEFLVKLNSNNQIKAVIINNNLLEYYMNFTNRSLTYILSETPVLRFYSTHQKLIESGVFYEDFDFESKFGKDCRIELTAIIERGVIIGNNVAIAYGSIIRKGSIIEDNVSIGSNTVIGSEGFQVITTGMNREKIKHVGGVLIKRNSSIGDNCNICNSLFEGKTIIGSNVQIDNLVHVAHNCIVEDNVVLTAGVILCGSSTIMNGSWIGTNATILNNVKIGSNSMIGIGSVVTKDVSDSVVAFGVPAIEIRENRKQNFSRS
jgi:UDP-3-O-[3-hydroxymyristoyl] glucosamine N-acyltransferase LpxD